MDVNVFLKELSKNWKEILENLVIQAKVEFDKNTININFLNSNLDIIPNTFGVYLFKIEPSKDFNLNKLKQSWRPKKTLKCPNFIKGNCIESNFGENYNFYIGKSEKLLSRIKEHCFHDIDKSTYGLKLKHREELLKSKISVTYFILEEIDDFKSNKEILQFVITNLVKELRKDLKPWIGKQ